MPYYAILIRQFSLLPSRPIHNRILDSGYNKRSTHERQNWFTYLSALILLAAVTALPSLPFRAGIAQGSPITKEIILCVWRL